MVEIDGRTLAILCQRLEPFGSLEVDDGRVVCSRSFRCASAVELVEALTQRRAGESLRVDAFPDGWKVRFWRALDVVLAADVIAGD